MTYMLANIMFYGVDSEPGEAEMDVGFFSMSWTEIRIGETLFVQCAVATSISTIWCLLKN